MSHYKKNKKKMQGGLIKLAHWIISSIEITDQSNFQENLYLINKQVEKLRKEFTNYR